ncbi:hypothetical protein KPRYC492_21915 [Klebsiella pneumoniae RYC492]|nr:hypothetical protein KPRYC492_21915 [Klebsiella pneumoniae RYC492]
MRAGGSTQHQVKGVKSGAHKFVQHPGSKNPSLSSTFAYQRQLAWSEGFNRQRGDIAQRDGNALPHPAFLFD